MPRIVDGKSQPQPARQTSSANPLGLPQAKFMSTLSGTYKEAFADKKSWNSPDRMLEAKDLKGTHGPYKLKAATGHKSAEGFLVPLKDGNSGFCVRTTDSKGKQEVRWLGEFEKPSDAAWKPLQQHREIREGIEVRHQLNRDAFR